MKPEGSQRPRATFCWFPPLSLRTGSLMSGALTFILETIFATRAPALLREMKPRGAQSPEEQAIKFSSTVLSIRVPGSSCPRAPGRSPREGIARSPQRQSPPLDLDRAFFAGARPKRQSSSSTCPCPSGRQSPISPALSLKLTSRSPDLMERWSTRRRSLAASGIGLLGKPWLMYSPIIFWNSSFRRGSRFRPGVRHGRPS